MPNEGGVVLRHMKAQKKAKSLVVFLLIICNALWAQGSGKISGKISDHKTGEELIGVTVVVLGTNIGAATDYEGNFIIGNLKPGEYTLQFSYVSYKKKVIEKVEVKANEVTNLNITLEENTRDLNEVVVKAEMKRESANTLLIQQKNAGTISDGLSIEMIRKTPDRNTGDVLKRVSGATIQDNKYAVIRGLPDRYNAAFINGSPLPSSEPDRRAFAFDIFPANLLDNLVIIKTATPDLSGEFAGGIIQIKTKDIPEQNFYQVSLGASYNTITTFRDFYKNVGGKYDFLGIDDGTRKLPSSFPDNETMRGYQNNIQSMDDVKRLVNIARDFNENYVLNKVGSMRPGYNFQFSMGQLKKLQKGEIGNVFAITSQNSPEFKEVSRSDYDNNGKLYAYLDKQYTINTLNGLLWNLSYKNQNNKISLKNILNVNSSDQTVLRTGQEIMNQFDKQSYAMWYTQNVLNSHQVNGEHALKTSKIKLNWNVGYSRLARTVPDFRRLSYQRAFITDPSDPNQYTYAVPISSTAQPEVAGRFYSNQLDHMYSASFDAAMPVVIGKVKNELKVGTYIQSRNRDFSARQMGYTFAPGSTNLDYTKLPLDQIFTHSTIDTNGFILKEVTTPTDAYQASSKLFAGYVRMDTRLFNRLKLIYGVRVESYNQVLNTYRTGINEKFMLDTTVVDFLPSLNTIYELSEKANLRFSFSQTVSRPEFRELAAFQFYDFNDLLLVEGNSNLKRTKVLNLDLRYEYFPGAGQVLSASVFYKKFNNPIEKILFSGGSPRLMSYQNVPSAVSYGVEFDYKLNFGKLLQYDENNIWSSFNFLGNVALIHSEVDLSNVIARETDKRPLQGQSPYIVNGGVQYTNNKHSCGASVMVNRIGQRISNAGNIEYASYWEKPRTVVDIQLNKTLFKNLDLRFSIRDLLAQNVVFYQQGDSKTGYNPKVDKDIWNFKVGSTYSISLSYRIQ